MSLAPVSDQAEIEAALRLPRAWILKHSTACSISSAAYGEVRSYADAHPDEPVAVIVIQTHRPISNWLAQKLSVVHQSPQLFLVENGMVRWQTTHWSISAAAMERAAAAK